MKGLVYNMRRISLLLVTVIILTLCSACSDDAPVNTGGNASSATTNTQTGTDSPGSVTLSQTYTNENERFSFSYPGDWSVVTNPEYYEVFDESLLVAFETPDGVMIIGKEKIGVNLFGTSVAGIETITEEDIIEEYSSHMDDIVVLDLSYVDIDGIPATRMVLSGNADGSDMAQLFTWYSIGSDGYIILLTIPSSNLARNETIFDAIMDSFGIIGGLGGIRIMVGETQPYNDEFAGNLEVTLEYVEFVDQIEDPLFGIYTLPDEGHIFLRAVFTTQNIDTELGGLVPGASKVVYDGIYEFNHHTFEGDFDVNPLSPPVTGLINYMVPVVVAESDNSLVIEFFKSMAGGDNVSFVVRPGASDPTSQDPSGGGASGPLTADEAWYMLQSWLDTHPLDEPKYLTDEYFEHSLDGQDYYVFSLDDMSMYWANFLVNKNNGEFLFMMISDGEETHIEVEPLQDWYDRYYR